MSLLSSVKIMIACTLANGDTIANLLMEQHQAILIIIILAYTEIITAARINQRCEQKKYNRFATYPIMVVASLSLKIKRSLKWKKKQN